MSAELITDAEFVAYIARAGVSGFTSDQRAGAIAGAVDSIRQAVFNAYTPESFEQLTAATAPDEMRRMALALALGVLTMGDAGRPDPITTAYNDAAKWLGLIVAGRTHYDKSPNAVLVRLSTGASAVSYRRAQSERVFDRCNASQEFNRRDPSI